MAGGQLVPHVLPNGQTIMVPGYLAPKPALAMPNVQPPGAGPDMRVAGPGGGPMAQWGNEIPTLPEPTPQEKAAEVRAKLMPQSPALQPVSNEHKSAPKQPDWMPSGKGKPSQSAKVDPSTLARSPAQSDKRDDSGDDMNPLVRAAMRYSPGGGGPRRSGGMEVGTIREEREPGKELLPEQLWAAGLARRPDELYELDPDKAFVADDPQLREKLTPVEQGAKAFGERGVREYERQVAAQHEQNLAAKSQLVQQSELMDQQLATIAQRRERIAKLQEVADQRTREAESFEPRTREKIWEDKGAFAQIMAGISIALGGYTQGLGRNGGHNPGLEMINKVLDSAVEDERSKSDRRRKVGLDAKSDLDKAMAIYGDLDLATIDVRNRKLANVMATTQNMLADRGIDAGAKDRGMQLMEQLKAQYLEGVRQQQDMLTGHAIKQEVNYKQAPATGGGGGGNDPLNMLKRGAEATKYVNTIEGNDNKPKPNPTEQATMNEQEANLSPVKDLLHKYRNSDEIPGVGSHNVVSRATRAAADFVGGDGTGTRVLDSDEERANRLIVDRAALKYRNDTTGAGGSAKELADIDRAFAGARTKHDLQVAVDTAERILAERRRLSAGGASRAGDGPQRDASEEPAR